jgi:hypothetical protein
VTSRERVDVFRWREGVCLAAAVGRDPFDGRVSTQLLAFAVLLSHCGKRSGEGIRLARVHAVFADRTARRYLSTLVHAGYVEQTARPARGQLGRPGRVAEYALTLPTGQANAGHDIAHNWPAKATTQLASVVLSVVHTSASDLRTTLAKSRAHRGRPLEEHSSRALRIAA